METAPGTPSATWVIIGHELTNLFEEICRGTVNNISHIIASIRAW